MKLTVKNEILYSGVDPCDDATVLTDESMLIDTNMDLGAQVELYFATASDGGDSDWTANGTADYPFLMQNAIEVSADQTTRVELRFNTAGTLTCIGVSAKLSAPTISVLNYVEEPASSSIVGDYWFVHYNVSCGIYDDATGEILASPSIGQVFERTNVISGWGTVTFDAEGNWSVCIGSKYEDLDFPGMAEHRHNLASYDPVTEGYFNPVDNTAAADATMGGQYVVAGSKVIMYTPGGGVIEGGLSSDGNTFVGAHLSTSETALIYAVRKTTGHALTLPADRKYVIGQPMFEIHYDEVVPPKTDRLHFNPSFMIIDSTANEMLEWNNPMQFTPNYESDILVDWTSDGPHERAQLMLSSDLEFRDDGLMTAGGDCFVALGAGGSGVFGGSNEEVDLTYGNHIVFAGFILDADTAPSLADLAGKWVLSMIEGEVEDGDDGDWNTGDETAGFGVSFGELTIDSSGNVTGDFVHKNAFTGEIEANPVTVTISAPVDECYAVGGDITDSECGGITLPVFTVTEGGETVAKIALDRTKNVISIWQPIDTDGIVHDSPDSNCTNGTLTDGKDCDDGTCDPAVTDPTDPDYCDFGDANPKFQFGLGVKVE